MVKEGLTDVISTDSFDTHWKIERSDFILFFDPMVFSMRIGTFMY